MTTPLLAQSSDHPPLPPGEDPGFGPTPPPLPPGSKAKPRTNASLPPSLPPSLPASWQKVIFPLGSGRSPGGRGAQGTGAPNSPYGLRGPHTKPPKLPPIIQRAQGPPLNLIFSLLGTHIPLLLGERWNKGKPPSRTRREKEGCPRPGSRANGRGGEGCVRGLDQPQQGGGWSEAWI